MRHNRTQRTPLHHLRPGMQTATGRIIESVEWRNVAGGHRRCILQFTNGETWQPTLDHIAIIMEGNHV